MITLQNALDEFLLDQQARMNSKKTIKNYSEVIGLWVRYAGESECIEYITKHDMRMYVLHMRDRDLSRESIRSYIRSLRVFWRFVSSEYQVHNAMESIKEPLRRSSQPKGIKEIDFIKMFNVIGDNEAGIRDRAVLCVFADTGARLGAVVSLTVDSIDTIKRCGTVTEKGNHQHTIYWTYYTNELLNKWLAVRPPTESRALFVSMREGQKSTALTKSGVYQILKRLKRKAGVTDRANPHSFRHNFARQYLLSGGDIVTLAKILNHKDVNMTAEYYAIFDGKELSQLQNEHSPLLKMLDLA